MKLTGRKRYRSAKTWWGKEILILQIEVEGNVPTNVGGYRIELEHKTWWRDATTADLTVEGN